MSNMMHLVAICGLVTLFPFVPAQESLVHENLYLNKFGDGKKRKRVSDVCILFTQARELLEKARGFLEQDEEGIPQQKRQAHEDKCGFHVQGRSATLHARERKGSLSSGCGLLHGPANQGLSRGRHIPVNELIGQVVDKTKLELQSLLLDHEVEMIAILGGKGIGKTMLMKHVYNYALESNGMLDRAFFWVTCPDQFSIKHFQDAVAMAVKCDLSGIQDPALRARKLSKALLSLGKIVMFLDAVPKVNFCPEQIGIPIASQGNSCKLVITTCSPLACGSLYNYRDVQVEPLSNKEGLELFMSEAGMDLGCVAQLNDIPRLLSKMCSGVPRRIVDTATQMRGIGDIREWRHKLNVGI